MKHIAWLLSYLIVTSLLCAQTGAADAGDRVVYEAAFDAAFAPCTALDMVKQTPGFVLAEDGDCCAAMRRGRQRHEVLRIELLRGSEVAGDASGAALLANVVRTPTSGGGAWWRGAELASRSPAPNGWFGVAGFDERKSLSDERAFPRARRLTILPHPPRLRAISCAPPCSSLS
jgi:hypothetical protein